MAKTKFIDNQLIKIRDKLPSVPQTNIAESGQENDQLSVSEGLSMEFVESEDKLNTKAEEAGSETLRSSERVNNLKKNPSKVRGGSAVANEREWKKAIFKRWDEFKNIRHDILKRLTDAKVMIPQESEKAFLKIKELELASETIENLLEDVKNIDDSTWSRQDFTAELARAMRKLEHCRLEYMMTISKIEKHESVKTASIDSSSGNNNSVIHELSSLSFQQCFKLGLGFFMPLIIAVFFATLLWGAIYFISIH